MIERDEIEYEAQAARMAAEADLKRPKRGQGLDSFAKRFAARMAKRGLNEAEAELLAIYYCGEAAHNAVCDERDALKADIKAARAIARKCGFAAGDYECAKGLVRNILAVLQSERDLQKTKGEGSDAGE